MSNRLPQSFLDELLTRIDIVSVIEPFVALKKAGTSYKACCPFHSEKTPSFVVTPTKQMYHCFGCGVTGNAIGFLMEYDHQSFREAVETLAAGCGLTMPASDKPSQDLSSQEKTTGLYEALQEASLFYQKQLRTHANKNIAIDYLKSRGLSGDICKQYALGFAPQGWSHLLDTLRGNAVKIKIFKQAGLLVEKTGSEGYDRFRTRIMFPIRDKRGRTMGFGGRTIDPEDSPKYLNSPETPIFQKRQTLYGLYEVLQTRQPISKLLVVEGYMDVVALAQFDIRYAVATLGTATTPEHIKLLLRYTEHIVFCFDGDAAGKAAALKALQTLLPFLQDHIQADFLFLPSDEDPDSLVRKEGKTAFEKRMSEAEPFSHYFFESLRAQVDLGELEGQAKLAHLAIPLLKQIPGPLLRHKLLTELSEHSGIERAHLEKSVGAVKAENEEPTFIPSIPAKPHSLMQKAISLLLQDPSLASKLPDVSYLQESEIPGSKIFLKLLELLHKNPHLSSAALIEPWREHSIFERLQQLAHQEILIAPDQMSLELQAILEKLMTQVEEPLIMRLQQKAEKNELTEAQKEQYLQLLRKRHP